MENMKLHFSEADLLETYYTQPGESLPVMMHLADCSECAARYERLERKLRGMSACHSDEKPETFWSRQRIGVMRKIDAKRAGSRVYRMAAAACFAVVVGGVTMWKIDEAPKTQSVAVTQTAAAPAKTTSSEETVPADPWKSEELKDYESMVAWETWVDTTQNKGDRS
jgi:anti-sigma factor RsiW